MDKPIWRIVEDYTEHRNPGYGKSRYVGGRRRLLLPCGHYELRKMSQAIPERVRCRSCEHLAGGGGSSQDNGDGTMTVFGWDKATAMPTKTIAPTTFGKRGGDHGTP